MRSCLQDSTAFYTYLFKHLILKALKFTLFFVFPFLMLENVILLLIHNLQACKQWIKQRGQHVEETTLFPNMHISVFTKQPRHQTTNCGTWKYLNHK